LKKLIKRLISRNRKINILVSLIRFILNFKLTSTRGNEKKFPKVIQLPITYQCNSKCIMCNVWKMDCTNELSIKNFRKAISDEIFKKVEAVGINGGEPSLVKDLEEYVKSILALPNIKSINIISHGFSSKLLLSKLQNIYNLCKNRKVDFSVLISLDGVGETHNIVRGKKGVFEKTLFSIKEISNKKDMYCDNLSLRCTLTKQNIEYWKELDVFVDILNISIEYGIAVDIKRIDNLNIHSIFSILDSNYHKQIAKELFYEKYLSSDNIYEKFKYYALYYYLENQKRLLGCSWKDRDITLDSKGNIYYCAVESDQIGNILEDIGKSIFFNEKNLKYRENIVQNKCDSCIHDYIGKIELKNGFIFLKYYIFQKFWLKIYRLKIFFLDLGVIK